jgi:hypothetical protein
MEQPLIFYSRSHVVADWQCPRRRYWNYEYGGRGIVGNDIQKALEEGIALHDALSEIAIQHRDKGAVDIDAIASKARQHTYEKILASMAGEAENVAMDYAGEQAALVEGIVRGFYRYQWPILISQYPTVMLVEQEITYEHGRVTQMSKPDLVLGNQETGEVWYIEYKSTSSKRPQWVNSWSTAIQLHATARGIEQFVHQPITGVIVQGLYKGYESYGKQSSPFCYAYTRGGNPPFTRPDVRYEYAAGYRRSATWLMEGGVKAWVAGMPEEILVNQFMQSAPIFINEEVLDRFLWQVESREVKIKDAVAKLTGEENPAIIQEIMDEVFPQHFSECQPAWGGSCSYRQLCHGGVREPMKVGFQWRESHHQSEREVHTKKENENG